MTSRRIDDADRSRYERLVRLHHQATWSTARRVVRSDADALDVVQQVFVRVLQGKVELPDDPADAAPRLRWLAARLALNHLRGARRRRRHEQEAIAMQQLTTTGTTGRDDDRRAVRDALGALPDEHRVPLALRFHDGMTLAAVADVLGCAESTALERVRRALDALRARLATMGFAATAARIDVLLPGSAAGAAVPAGLESALLALRAPALLASAGAKLAVALATVAALAAGVAVVATDRSAAPRDPLAAAATSAPRADAGVPITAADEPGAAGTAGVARTPVVGPAVPPSAAREVAVEQDLPTARLTGRALDPGTGAAIEGARVVAQSEETRGKSARFAVTAASDARGAFELALPVAHDGGQAYRVIVTREDHVTFRSPRLVARAGATLAPLVAELRCWAEDVAGEWTMDVAVTDAQGQPVPKAVVTVLRQRPSRGPAERDPIEASARVSDGGLATLHGDHHGEKLLRVSVFGSELAPVELPLRIDDPGPHLRRVTLQVGATIAGRVVAVADDSPVAAVWVEARRDGDKVAQARTDADGRFTLRGLGDGEHTLGAALTEWSGFAIERVVAGADDVVIRLKARDDPRPHGDHLGEIHGRIVDAVTGEPLAVSPYAVRAHWIAPEVDDVRRDVLPSLLSAGPMQVAQMSVQTVGQIDGEPVLRRPRRTAVIRETDLRAGRYLVLVHADDRALGWAGPFDVGPGRLAADVVVALERGATVRGTVHDAAGRPVAGARVWVGPATPGGDDARAATARTLAETGTLVDREPGAVTDDAGRFAIPHVPSGLDLRVHVVGTAGQGAGPPFVLRSGETTRDAGVVVAR